MLSSQDVVLPINHIADSRYIRHRKQEQIEKYVIRKNSTRIEYDYIVGDKVVIGIKTAVK